ncbi:MAG: flagellar basal body P-ring formation protein FlgA [Burkholderiales bacterium]|nr:flagellar basal body P-ring formation protein FlgA [Burkholderiales bacterium]
MRLSTIFSTLGSAARRSVLFGICYSLPMLALAQEPPAAKEKQNLDVLRSTAEQFLRTQTANLPGQVSVTIGNVDNRLNLAACAAPQAFLPPGSRAWGKTTVGVRCVGTPQWTMFIQASVKVVGEYVAASVPLQAGQTLQASQLLMLQGDLTTLPAGIVTDINQALGRSSAQAVAAGAPLRQDALRTPQVIQQGQLVKVIASGAGFRVASEGRAINNANDGQPIQVKTASGQQLSGIAQAGGIVQINY